MSRKNGPYVISVQSIFYCSLPNSGHCSCQNVSLWEAIPANKNKNIPGREAPSGGEQTYPSRRPYLWWKSLKLYPLISKISCSSIDLVLALIKTTPWTTTVLVLPWRGAIRVPTEEAEGSPFPLGRPEPRRTWGRGSTVLLSSISNIYISTQNSVQYLDANIWSKFVLIISPHPLVWMVGTVSYGAILCPGGSWHCYLLRLSLQFPCFGRETWTVSDVFAIESRTAPFRGSSDMSIHDMSGEGSLKTHCSTSLSNVCVARKWVNSGDSWNFVKPSARFSSRRIQTTSAISLRSKASLASADQSSASSPSLW